MIENIFYIPISPHYHVTQFIMKWGPSFVSSVFRGKHATIFLTVGQESAKIRIVAARGTITRRWTKTEFADFQERAVSTAFDAHQVSNKEFVCD